MPGKFSRNGGKVALGTLPLDSWLALCITAPTADTLGMEYSAVGYARRPCRLNLLPTDTDPPVVSNLSGVTFGPFLDNLGEEVGWVMMMQNEAGGTPVQMRAFWELDEPKTPDVGDTLILDVGALTLHCS
jgi:hypothetical protein